MNFKISLLRMTKVDPGTGFNVAPHFNSVEQCEGPDFRTGLSRCILPLTAVKRLLGVFILFLMGAADAATVNVSVINFAFSPATANINVDDTVVWIWNGQNHDVVSTDSPQAWPPSPVKSTPFSFTNQFTSAGSFPYECTVHGFTGTIKVTAPHTPPTVHIASPVTGTVFAAPANISISASATDSDGTVTNVEFFLGTAILTNIAVAPFSLVASNVLAGNYALAAVATDSQGARATNSVNVSVVAPVRSAISGPKLISTNFVFTFNATVGLDYIVQVSTDLLSSNWSSVFTNAPASNAVVTVQLPLTSTSQYYRVGRLPNP